MMVLAAGPKRDRIAAPATVAPVRLDRPISSNSFLKNSKYPPDHELTAGSLIEFPPRRAPTYRIRVGRVFNKVFLSGMRNYTKLV